MIRLLILTLFLAGCTVPHNPCPLKAGDSVRDKLTGAHGVVLLILREGNWTATCKARILHSGKIDNYYAAEWEKL